MDCKISLSFWLFVQALPEYLEPFPRETSQEVFCAFMLRLFPFFFFFFLLPWSNYAHVCLMFWWLDWLFCPLLFFYLSWMVCFNPRNSSWHVFFFAACKFGEVSGAWLFWNWLIVFCRGSWNCLSLWSASFLNSVVRFFPYWSTVILGSFIPNLSEVLFFVSFALLFLSMFFCSFQWTLAWLYLFSCLFEVTVYFYKTAPTFSYLRS